EDMAAAQASGKATVFPAPFQMKTGVVPAFIVPDPFTVTMDVRRIGVPFPIAKLAVFLRRSAVFLPSLIMAFTARRGGAARRDVPPSGFVPLLLISTLLPGSFLRHGRSRYHQHRYKNPSQLFHIQFHSWGTYPHAVGPVP